MFDYEEFVAGLDEARRAEVLGMADQIIIGVKSRSTKVQLGRRGALELLAHVGAFLNGNLTSMSKLEVGNEN